MVKVFLDYGHGGTDPGASGSGLREKDMTLQIGRKVHDLLKGKVTVYESRNRDVTVSLRERTNKANKLGADVFISIHINSFSTTTANGVETFSYPNSANGAKLAKVIQDELVGTKLFKSNRGTKTANFHVLRESNMPAALTELGFIGNKHDADVMKNKQDELARAIANGILKHVGKGGGKPVKPSKPSSPKPAPNPSKKSVATIAREVLAGKWGNNPKRKNDLIKAGYDYNAIQAEVNKLAGAKPKPSKPKLKSTSVIADEVISGKWGNGNDRTIRLRKAGYNPAAIQKEVNRKLGANPKPSFNANSIAQQIKKGIDNKGKRIPNGHANRRKHFGLTNAQYQQVRSIVNRIM